MLRRFAIPFAVVLWAVAGVVSPVGASCIGYQDPEAEFRKAVATRPVVFVGRVTAVQNQGRTALVSVRETWRGAALPEQVVVHGSPSTASNAFTSVDRTFAPGQDLIFLPEGNRSPFSDNSCSFTREFTPDVEQLRPVGAGDPGSGAAGNSSAFPSAGVAIGAGVGVVLIAALWLTHRSRSAGSPA